MKEIRIETTDAEKMRMTLAVAIGLLEEAESRGIAGVTTEDDDGNELQIPTSAVIDRLREIIHIFGGPNPSTEEAGS